MEHMDLNDFEPELRPAAERIAHALRSDLPPDVAEQHVALLRTRARRDAPTPALRQVGFGDTFAPSARRRIGRRTAVLALAAVLVLALSSVAMASNGSAPGGVLYPVDRALERLELVVRRSPGSQADTHLEHAAERIEEAALVGEDDPDAVPRLLEDAAASHRSALDALEGSSAADRAEIREHVLEAIGRHVARLEALRDRLQEMDLPSQAIDALTRAIGNANRAMEVAGPPADAGRPDDAGRPADRPSGPPTDPGRPDDAGPPADGPAGPPDDAGRPDGAPQQQDPGPPAGQGPPDGQGRPDDPGSQSPGSEGGPTDRPATGPPSS